MRKSVRSLFIAVVVAWPTLASRAAAQTAADSTSSGPPRRGFAADIERAGQQAQKVLQVNWFGGGQAASEVNGCLLTLQATKTVGKISALYIYRVDVGQLDDSLSKRDDDSDAMVSSRRFVRRDGTRIVTRDSSQVLGPKPGAAPTDSLDYLEIGAAYGNPGRRLESMITALNVFRDVCRPPAVPAKPPH